MIKARAELVERFRLPAKPQLDTGLPTTIIFLIGQVAALAMPQTKQIKTSSSSSSPYKSRCNCSRGWNAVGIRISGLAVKVRPGEKEAEAKKRRVMENEPSVESPETTSLLHMLLVVVWTTFPTKEPLW